jgi:inhibitor of cysteine peptidase
MPTLTLTQTDKHRSFNVQKGDQVVVRLEESPTTGHRWAIDDVGPAILTLQNDDFSPAGSGVGGGGERTLTFIAQNAGTTHIQLKLWRDWEGPKSITSRFDVAVSVT